MQLFDQLHPDWKSELAEYKKQISKIEAQLNWQHVTPPAHQVFRALQQPITSIKVVIFGQDPYPGMGHAHGYAFSAERSVKPIPASLKNIFQELSNDLGGEIRQDSQLEDWANQGVLLLNRILTTNIGVSLAHKSVGWQEITNAVAEVLGKHRVVAILWGKSAGELRHYFKEDFVVESSHPSPLAAYRGFFGSRPFSRSNSILVKNGITPIKW